MVSCLKRHTKVRKAREAEGPWPWELVALTISIVSLLAIIVIASTSHGKLSTRLPFGITLNAAISVCSTIMKTTILYCAAEAISQSKWIWFHRQHQRLGDVELYDQASRGPWGALTMLWRVRWKDLSSLSALVMIYSLAIDPFAQQVTHFRLEKVVADSPATVNVQWILSAASDFWQLQSAFISACFTSAALGTFSSCSSGNCSWTPYQSLAICHQCLDISDQIHINDSCYYAPDATCAAYLPNGSSLEFGLSRDHFQATMMNTTGNDAVLQIENAGLSLLNFTKITIDYDSENIYTAFTFECFNGTFHDHSLDPQCIRNLRTLLAASECTLSWCINRYSAKQESGTFHENYLDSWQLQHSPEIVNSTASSIEYMRMVPLVEDGNVTILEQNVDRENADYLLTPVPAQDLASYTPCYVEREVHERLGRSLARFFTTSLNYTRGWVPSRADLTTLDPAVVLYGLNKVARGANDLKKDPVSKVFADVAHGLTQYIRQDSTVYQGMHGSLTGGTRLGNGEGNFQATGTTFEDRTIVRVRWGWLAFPVGLVAILVY